MQETIIERDGMTILVRRYGFQAGYYAEARDKSGKRLSFTGVFRGPGCKEKAIRAAIEEAKTGNPAAGDIGCPG